jgi:four helix bundle protein
MIAGFEDCGIAGFCETPRDMDRDELRQRSKAFALRVMKLADALPKRRSANAIGNQVIRSGTSVGANYRAACRARSKAEFIAKIGVVVEETDETAYWLELITESGLLPTHLVEPLLTETHELLAIFSRSHATARHNAIAEKKSRNPAIPKSRNP